MQHLARGLVGNDGAHGKAQRNILAGRAKHVRAHAVFTTARFVAARVAVVDQGVQVGIGHAIDVATAPAVTAVGAAEFFVFFVPKRCGAVAAVPGNNFYGGFIDEFHGGAWLSQKNAAHAARPAAYASRPGK